MEADQPPASARFLRIRIGVANAYLDIAELPGTEQYVARTNERYAARILEEVDRLLANATLPPHELIAVREARDDLHRRLQASRA